MAHSITIETLPGGDRLIFQEAPVFRDVFCPQVGWTTERDGFCFDCGSTTH